MTRLRPPSDYAPKWCRSRLCKQRFNHAGDCDGATSAFLVTMAASLRSSLRAKGVRNRRAFVKRSPRALPYALSVQIRPADIHPRHLRHP